MELPPQKYFSGPKKIPEVKGLQAQQNGDGKASIPSSTIQTVTVGSGIAPDLPEGSRTVPPVGNCTLP
jgi:hypothetical protein